MNELNETNQIKDNGLVRGCAILFFVAIFFTLLGVLITYLFMK
ncbi:MAG: hypothetical protein WBA59_03880 [Moheibacter sp.]